jgi:hypothetical protein
MNYELNLVLDAEARGLLVQDLGLPPDAHDCDIAYRLARQSSDGERVEAARQVGLPETASWEDIRLEQRGLQRRARPRMRKHLPS